MSRENINQFCLLVLQDLSLQNELKNLTDRDEFIRRVIDLGKQSGFEISRHDVEEKLRESRRRWHERWI